MTYSQVTLVQRVRNLIGLTGETDFIGNITGAVNNSVTTIPVNDGTDWEEGDVLEFLPDGERTLVRSVSSNNLTVARGQFGTAATSHSSADLVKKNPNLPVSEIHDAIEVTMQSLWPLAWDVASAELTPSATATWYNLATDFIDLISVTQIYNTYSVQEYGNKSTTYPVLLQRNLPATIAASGYGISFPGGLRNATNTIFVKYRRPFTGAVSGSNYTEISNGLPVEVVAHGAAARIARSAEGPKVILEDQAQGERGQQSGDRLAYGAELEGKFIALLSNWHDQLMRTATPMGELK